MFLCCPCGFESSDSLQIMPNSLALISIAFGGTADEVPHYKLWSHHVDVHHISQPCKQHGLDVSQICVFIRREFGIDRQMFRRPGKAVFNSGFYISLGSTMRCYVTTKISEDFYLPNVLSCYRKTEGIVCVYFYWRFSSCLGTFGEVIKLNVW